MIDEAALGVFGACCNLRPRKAGGRKADQTVFAHDRLEPVENAALDRQVLTRGLEYVVTARQVAQLLGRHEPRQDRLRCGRSNLAPRYTLLDVATDALHPGLQGLLLDVDKVHLGPRLPRKRRHEAVRKIRPDGP